ncbi:aminoacyl-tRNA hydrolase [Pseudophaeobacter arcticus]|uniref:aminoacyl-tRNA hydrolase n=1 Tax=Pseudophaeobacter arcticus TaxID=385492 RepID=UPI00041DD52D|nr:aminoacyl-tRNA hydrolase [Pseudophaeobacter arcticus]
MKLFVGLGNPGAKYARNRHNIGFMALDEIASDHGFSPWKAKFQGQICEGTLGGIKVLLLKPQTFMNLSGQSVGEAMRFYKLTSADVIVLHDELDLAPGKCRVKQGGGHAGHNGLRSLHSHIGAEYGRVRLGVGHPGHKDAVAGYVLRDFPKADEVWLDDLLRGISDGAAALAAGDGGKFMNAVSLRVAPPRSSGGSKPATGKKPAPQPAAEKPASQPSSKPARAPASTKAPQEPDSDSDSRSALEKLVQKFK